MIQTIKLLTNLLNIFSRLFDLSHDEIVRSDNDKHRNDESKDGEYDVVEPLEVELPFDARAQVVVDHFASVRFVVRFEHSPTIVFGIKRPLDNAEFSFFFILFRNEICFKEQVRYDLKPIVYIPYPEGRRHPPKQISAALEEKRISKLLYKLCHNVGPSFQCVL